LNDPPAAADGANDAQHIDGSVSTTSADLAAQVHIHLPIGKPVDGTMCPMHSKVRLPTPAVPDNTEITVPGSGQQG
jgi:hypothetical protein